MDSPYLKSYSCPVRLLLALPGTPPRHRLWRGRHLIVAFLQGGVYVTEEKQCMEQMFEREMTSLTGVFGMLDEFITREGISETVRLPLHFAVEEVFTNMVKYNPGEKRAIRFSASKEDLKVVLTLVDYTTAPYDLTRHKDTDTGMPAEERRIGGLGIHLTRKFVDEIRFHHEGEVSTTTLIKYLESPHV